MTSTSTEVTDQDVQGRIDQFMTRFKIATLLNLSGIRKMRGIPYPQYQVAACFR